MTGSEPSLLDGPAPRERSLAARLLFAVSAIMSCLVLVVVLGGYALYEHFDRQISRLRLTLDGDRPPEGEAGSTNFLLVGSDSREGTNGEFESLGEVTGERSDTTILAHLDADGTTTLISFPRDTLVYIPGHGRDKLTQAIAFGGPSLLVRTIEKLTGIRIDHYVSVNLAGFREMTDAIGGVTVCIKPLPDGSDSNLRDEWSQWRGKIGENHLDGEAALAFVRQRHGLPNNDFDRIRRQQQFIGAVFRKATSEGVLTNPARLENLLSAATRSLTIDDGTDIDDLRLLARRLANITSDQVRFATIPVYTPTPADGADELGQLPGYGAVQLYDRRELDEFLAPLRGDREPQRPKPTAAPPTLDAEDVSVDVHNGSGVRGLAASTSRQLAALGFTVGSPRDWSGGRVEDTEIRHRPGDEAAARAVAAVVPGGELVRDDDVPKGRVWLVLGESFESVDTRGAPQGEAAAGAGTAGAPGDEASGAPRGSSNGSGGSRPADEHAASRLPQPVTATELTDNCTY